MSYFEQQRIALVHDELTRRGGAENVLVELIRLFPHADIYALYAGKPQITVDGTTHPVTTSFLQRFPRWFRQHPRRLAPFLSYAAEQLDLSNYDLVMSSASAFAKAVVTRAHIPHVCYCHTPTRYLWDETHEAAKRSNPLGRSLLHFLRLADFAAAQRVDHFIANSNWTQERISTYYRRESTVVYPPVDTQFFTPGPRNQSERKSFVCVGRLTRTKHFEDAIAVCEKLELPLTIIGHGSEATRLKKLAGPYTTFLGKVSNERLRQELRRSRALLQPGREDFGIATAEAGACGIPVIAWRVGGAQEIVRHHETGILYPHEGPEALAEAVRQFVAAEETFQPETAQQRVLKFSRQQFHHNLRHTVAAITAD